MKTLGTIFTDRSDVHELIGSEGQFGADKHAYQNYFYGRGSGLFMELGALNGRTFSNTLALDELLGWKGVHIEASPSSYAELVKHRPDQVCVFPSGLVYALFSPAHSLS